MSEDSDQEKTELPTEKRLRETREKGDVPRSRDLSGALVVMAGVWALVGGGKSMFVHAHNLFALGMGYSREALLSGDLPGRALRAAVHEALGMFGPVAAATVAAVFAAPLLLGGISFSAEALQPKFERLDPIIGLACHTSR